MLGQWEWIILLVGFLFLLIWELRSVRRSIRAAKAEEAARSGRDRPS